MRRLALVSLLLAAAPALCWAADVETESNPAPKKGACVYARPAAQAAGAEGDAPQARPSVPSAARSVPKAPATTAGGGGDAEPARVRGPRWHSFLPGMFR